MADDLGWAEVGCYGQQKIPTPNIDRLAAQGMRFTQHYSGAPVCAPSRCVLMTGKHLGHAEVRGNQQARVTFPEFTEGQYPLGEQAVTIAQVFQKAGYTTGAMGKWGLGPVGSTGDPNRQGFDLFFGYNCQAIAHSFYPPHLWRNADKITINTTPVPGHAKQPEGEVRMEDWIGETYAPHLIIAEAEKFIADNAARPFFLYLPFIEPHVAIHPPLVSVEKFPAQWDNEVYRGGNGYLPHPRPRAGYAAMIHDLDSYVGRQTRFAAVLQIVKAGYEDLIELRDTLSPATHLFFHGYDFAIPDGRGICHLGPWLKPTFQQRKFPDTTVIAGQVVKIMLQKFATMLESLQSQHDLVTFINGQGTLNPVPGSWHNELHPGKSGFQQFAAQFHRQLQAQFPDRLPSELGSARS